MTTRPVGDRLGRLALAGPGGLPWLIIVALIGVGIAVVGLPNPTGDSGALITGAQAIRGCLSDPSRWGACDGIPFAPLQYIPAIVLLEFGASTGQVMAALSVISAAAFALTLWMVWRLLGTSRVATGAAGMLLVLTGPLIHYAASAFGEMLAAAAFVAVIYSLAQRAPLPAIIGATWLAGISKDTALPFVLAIAIVVIFRAPGRPSWAAVRAPVLAVVAGSILAAGTVAALNLLRWGVPTNAAYNWDPYTTPLSQVPRSAAGLLASPQGGMIVFWPAAALVLAANVMLAIRAARRPKGERLHDLWPALLILATGVMQLVVLAFWWAPFGWSAWGPRLALPVVTGLAVLTIWRYQDEFHRALTWVGRRAWALVPLAAVLLFSALTNLGALLRPLIGVFSNPAPDGICPDIPFSESTVDGYYRCLNHVMWHYDPPVILLGARQLTASTGILLFSVVFGAAVALLTWMSTRPDPGGQ